MFFEIIVAVLIGIALGSFTGLIPGIHTNLISAITVASSPLLLLHFSLLQLIVFIISMSITHSFLNSIPGVYLGAPDESMILAALPGHRMLMNGNGHQAVILTLIGSLISLLICMIFAPSAYIIISAIYKPLRPYIGMILIAIMVYMIFKDSKRYSNLLMFLLSGIFGLIALNSSAENVLFPMLSGLFGLSILITSLENDNPLPKQNPSGEIDMGRDELVKATLGASGIGFVAAFLPGFGSSQAAILATQIIRDISEKGFLILVGGINTVNMALSITTLYAIDKARNGSVVAIKDLVGGLTVGHIALLYAAMLVAGCLAFIIGCGLSKSFSAMVVKVNYRMLVAGIILFITMMAIYFDGVMGLSILIVATSIGLTAAYLGVGKNHLMGCLILPVIIYLL